MGKTRAFKGTEIVRLWVFVFSTVMLSGTFVSSAFAQTEAMDASQEKQALQFVRVHHPELERLLRRLQGTNRTAYEKAIGDVYLTSERLAKLQSNDEERFALALKIWTLDSRIRLLVARSTMSADPELEDQLRQLLRERQQVRLELLQLDRSRALARVERLDAQIEQLTHDSEASVENDFARIKREMRASASRDQRKEREEARASKSESDQNLDREGTSSKAENRQSRPKKSSPK